jgi:hypothetical protein
MAGALQPAAVRTHPLLAWIVTPDEDAVRVRLVTDAPTAYVLLSHALAGLQAQLPVWCEPIINRPIRH